MPTDDTAPITPAEREGHAARAKITDQPVRRLRVEHTTRYSYDAPIPRSKHVLHLRPLEDRKQTVLSHDLVVKVDGEPLGDDAGRVDYDDAFGNAVTKFEINRPYTHLEIVSDSTVDLLDTDPFAFANQLPIRPQFPLVWMPRERTVLAPFLTSVELPDTQLQEIYDYAKYFVVKNNGDLMETLFNMNLEFFKGYGYKPGFTSNNTSVYEVYTTRAGVCQDFAGLFICMARLLGLPARYVCGYIYTGNTGDTGDGRAQSDASHAWLQLYIPDVGWRGFDPTNGVLPATGHVRVAVGRHFRDTPPTDGTLYGSAKETLDTAVVVEEVGRGVVKEELVPAA